MKKIIALLFLSLFPLVLTSCKAKEEDIINPNAEFLYFYGATCPHCQELNKIMQSRDLWTKIPVEKREVYYNRENSQKFLDLTEDLGLKDAGVPFVYDTITKKYAVGVKPALELMTSRLGQTPTSQSGETLSSSGKTDILQPFNTPLAD